MTTQDQISSTGKAQFLRRALTANGIFTLVSGAGLMIGADFFADLLGLNNPLILTAVGLMLVLYAPFVFWVSLRKPILRQAVIAIILLDLFWVLGSALLLIGGWLPLSTTGKWLVAITADIVAVFAVLQTIGLRRLEG